VREDYIFLDLNVMNKKIINKIKKELMDEKERLEKTKVSTEIDVEGDEADEIQAKIISLVSKRCGKA
jgi:uncharacterized OsmC-like protein